MCGRVKKGQGDEEKRKYVKINGQDNEKMK
jgi:hypothetical protein